MAEPFSLGRAEQIVEAFDRHGVRYMFIGKFGAVVLGFPDTTQDADLYLEKTPDNGRAAVDALVELGFALTSQQRDEIGRAKDFIQLRNGPFLLDLVFAPDGIERFEDAFDRSLVVGGIRVAHLDDIIRSKEEANRVKDRESLPRLKAFRDWWVRRPR